MSGFEVSRLSQRCAPKSIGIWRGLAQLRGLDEKWALGHNAKELLVPALLNEAELLGFDTVIRDF